MKKEYIINSEEMLDMEQLDAVAGGASVGA